MEAVLLYLPGRLRNMPVIFFVSALLLTLGNASAAVINQYSSLHRLTGSSFGISGRNVTYDYVIVGAGIAGSVAATRLAQNNASVALVEAGSFYGTICRELSLPSQHR